ncbi:MAG: SpoIIE family protein phosphatase [Bacteroidales bacterium]|nr:SpoIIE family protein phosphatase [Bacteroidales bacterium]
MNNVKNTLKSAHNRSSIAILITAAALMLLISAIQQYSARKQIRNDLERNAEIELVIKSIAVKHSLEDVELALRNRNWEFEQFLPYPDSLFAITRRIVEQNPDFDGCCIAVVPNYYPEKGRLFEPYTVRRGDSIETVQLASEEHDYSKNKDFILAAKNDSSFWGEPYPDESDPKVTLITYTFPIHDEFGDIAAVVGVDYNAEELGKMLNARHMFPSSYHILISGQGKLICGPEEVGNTHQLAEETLDMINDSTFERHASSTGHSTLLSFIDNEDGSKGYVFYSSPKSIKPWRIAVVNYDDEVFEPLIKIRWRDLLLTMAGLLVLAFIVQRSAKNISKLQQATIEREHIDSELNIARKIQMDMLPKGEKTALRDDCDVVGLLDPARMVGGDLYDHFIRDEKLYFCIGDVSGKGVPAALVMAVAHTLFRSISAHESNPARIMQALNETSCQRNEQNMFVTMFIGVLDLPTGRLRYCNAGHDKPFVIGEETKQLPAKPHLPLGVMDNMIYTTQETVLLSGESLFLYTDGLTEAMNESHEQFGLKRVEKGLRVCIGKESNTSEKLIRIMTNRVNAFVDGAEQSDDLTMLAIHYTPQEKSIIFFETLTFINKVSEITKLNAFVKSATTALNMETGLANQIKLAVEEAVTNIIDYAYQNGTEGNISVTIEADESRIRFILTDSGAEFDPTSVSKADTTLSVEERPIGGLGVFLVRNLMDSINYERVDGKNVLRMEKRYA